MKSDYRFRDLDAVNLSNHSRVSDVVPSPENVSQSEIERLRAINAQLVAALREIAASTNDNRCTLNHSRIAYNALNAAEKESNK
jgi:hypothetical protein